MVPGGRVLDFPSSADGAAGACPSPTVTGGVALASSQRLLVCF